MVEVHFVFHAADVVNLRKLPDDVGWDVTFQDDDRVFRMTDQQVGVLMTHGHISQEADLVLVTNE